MINRLTAHGYKPGLCRLLFIAALAICQFSLVLHQMDIEHHADGKKCTICLASQGLGHALATDFLSPIVHATAESPAVLTESLPVIRTLVRLVARSPPVPALHA